MKISSIMSPGARRIESTSSLDVAQEMMKKFGIRHLPVTESGDVVGMLTEQDLKLSLQLCKTTGECPNVGAVCRCDPLIVDANDSVSGVVKVMAEKKYDSCLVADEQDNLVGIVTTTDICRLLGIVLDERNRQ